MSVDGAPCPGDEVGYYDRSPASAWTIVGKLVPTSASPSNLPRAPEFLRICPHCEELVGRDLSDCPYCRRRMPALARQP